MSHDTRATATGEYTPAEVSAKTRQHSRRGAASGAARSSAPPGRLVDVMRAGEIAMDVAARQCRIAVVGRDPMAALDAPGLSLKAQALVLQIAALEGTAAGADIPTLCSVARDGRDAVRTGLWELEDAGLLLRCKLRRADGRWLDRDTAVLALPPQSGLLPLVADVLVRRFGAVVVSRGRSL